MDFASEAGDRATEGNIYFNLGNAYDSISDFTKAIECYEKCLDIAKEAVDGAREGKALIFLSRDHSPVTQRCLMCKLFGPLVLQLGIYSRNNNQQLFHERALDMRW